MANTDRVRRALELVTLAQQDPAGPSDTLTQDFEAGGPEQLVDTLMGLIDLTSVILLLRRAETGRTIPDQLADLGQRLAASEARGI